MTKKRKNFNHNRATLRISESAKKAFKKITNKSQKEFSKTVSTLFEIFDQTTLDRLRVWTRIPNAEDRRRMTNERILASLKRVGVAQQSEVDDLRAKVERLESSQLKSRSNQRSRAHT
jgi:hypothetical protein